MSKPQIQHAIALVVNDHSALYDGRSETIECLCGSTFPYHSRHAAHVAEAIVTRVLGGDL